MSSADPLIRGQPSTTMTVGDGKYTASGLPRIHFDLLAHKTAIAIQWTAIFVSSGLLPIGGFLALHYATNLPLGTAVSPWLGVAGVTSLYSLLVRSWALIKKHSTCRPLGSDNRWALDYFGWNFLFGFLALVVLIAVGTATSSIYVLSLPISFLLAYVCLELLIVQLLMAMGVRAPFRFSSVAGGEPLRPGSYIIAEDVVAVDGNEGREFRQAWNDRYEASATFREHLCWLDLIWGFSGLAIVGAISGVVFGVENHIVGYCVGWGLPWAWAGLMTIVTIRMSKRMLKREEEKHPAGEA